MEISGSEHADSAANAALQKDVSDCLISYTDAYQYISQYVHNLCQSEWTRLLTTSFMLQNP